MYSSPDPERLSVGNGDRSVAKAEEPPGDRQVVDQIHPILMPPNSGAANFNEYSNTMPGSQGHRHDLAGLGGDRISSLVDMPPLWRVPQRTSNSAAQTDWSQDRGQTRLRPTPLQHQLLIPGIPNPGEISSVAVTTKDLMEPHIHQLRDVDLVPLQAHCWANHQDQPGHRPRITVKATKKTSSPFSSQRPRYPRAPHPVVGTFQLFSRKSQ